MKEEIILRREHIENVAELPINDDSKRDLYLSILTYAFYGELTPINDPLAKSYLDMFKQSYDITSNELVELRELELKDIKAKEKMSKAKLGNKNAKKKEFTNSLLKNPKAIQEDSPFSNDFYGEYCNVYLPKDNYKKLEARCISSAFDIKKLIEEVSEYVACNVKYRYRDDSKDMHLALCMKFIKNRKLNPTKFLSEEEKAELKRKQEEEEDRKLEEMYNAK